MRFQSWYERIKDSKTLDFLKLSRENQSKERRIIEVGMVLQVVWPFGFQDF